MSAKITINRPQYRAMRLPQNPLGTRFHCREAQNIRVVISTGAGDKAFCSGGDMQSSKGTDRCSGEAMVRCLSVLDV